MIDFFASFASLVMMIFLSTAGSALLLKFWAGNLSRSTRILLAIAAGTLLPFLPLTMMANTYGEIGMEMAIQIGAVLTIPMLVVGWPIAFFATRKLDKLTEIKASVFE
ncbi:hypothetical protein [Pontixanthobacter sp. CEM42]|uniref:hypothetical protein n=1 Tax=Pontixanthobacter sp. CEM42 TaxID=2792077 RepID=UPI001AE001C4|nr:hypothetical protein [Pontixanthobacter sp. CEM42]